MEKEQAARKGRELLVKGKKFAGKLIHIAGKLAAAKFFLPVVTAVSAALLFAGTVRRYGIKAAVQGAARAEKQLHPEKLRKWKRQARKRRNRRRIALLRILASKKTKKKPGYKKFIKVLKLYN